MFYVFFCNHCDFLFLVGTDFGNLSCYIIDKKKVWRFKLSLTTKIFMRLLSFLYCMIATARATQCCFLVKSSDGCGFTDLKIELELSSE